MIHPTQYVFREDTGTCSPVYTAYYGDPDLFRPHAAQDPGRAKQSREYAPDMANHPNRFDASCISRLSCDSLDLGLPDGNPFFMPIVNRGRFREEGGGLMMQVIVHLNRAVADGFLVVYVFRLPEKEIAALIARG